MRSLMSAGLIVWIFASPAGAADPPTPAEARAALDKAATYYRERVAVRGGYVYYASLDLKRRFGEGEAAATQIWVQPPGTPTVGMAYLKAFEATGSSVCRQGAEECVAALLYGQLASGGWTNSIDFEVGGPRTALYRNGKGKGRNHSTLDDGITTSALRFLMRAEHVLKAKDSPLSDGVEFGLKALLAAQFPNGAFPQVWTGPVAPQPVLPASYPKYDWRTEGRVKEYWDRYTLNDNVAGNVTATLVEAYELRRDERCRQALARFGDFLLSARMPSPQPAWCQQYGFDMHPIWARKFEPPAIAGRESQDVLDALLAIHAVTGDAKYLAPHAETIAYLRKSLLPDGRLARYYELQSNRPLYMARRGDVYTLTYDDSDLPAHYGWKTDAELDRIEKRLTAALAGKPVVRRPDAEQAQAAAGRALASLDAEGRWVSTFRPDADRLVGQPKFPAGFRYLDSAIFAENLTALAEFAAAEKK